MFKVKKLKRKHFPKMGTCKKKVKNLCDGSKSAQESNVQPLKQNFNVGEYEKQLLAMTKDEFLQERGRVLDALVDWDMKDPVKIEEVHKKYYICEDLYFWNFICGEVKLKKDVSDGELESNEVI